MTKKIKDAKDKAHLKYRKKLFKLYLQTARDLRMEMDSLFNTGIDTEKKISSLSVGMKNNYSYFFTEEMIKDFRKFLDEILQFENFPNGSKPFQEFLFEKSSRYSLSTCYPKFTLLNDIEIAYAEDIAQYNV